MGPIEYLEELWRTLWQMLFIAAYTAFVYVPTDVWNRFAARAS